MSNNFFLSCRTIFFCHVEQFFSGVGKIFGAATKNVFYSASLFIWAKWHLSHICHARKSFFLGSKDRFHDSKPFDRIRHVRLQFVGIQFVQLCNPNKYCTTLNQSIFFKFSTPVGWFYFLLHITITNCNSSTSNVGGCLLLCLSVYLCGL
jgi:hypothetical protein